MYKVKNYMYIIISFSFIYGRRFANHRRPPKFGDCGRIVKISVYWKCYGTAPAHILGKILVEIFLTTGCIAELPEKWSITF